MGADNAIHLMDPSFNSLDSLTTARLLAKTIALIGFDLILCGKQAVDDDMGQIGPAIAVYLEIPCVTVVTKLEFIDDWKRIKVSRQIEGGSEIIESPLPGLVTCQKGLNQPRLPSLKGIMAAKKKEIQIFDAEKINLVPSVIGDIKNNVIQADLELPPPRAKGTIFDGPVNEVVSKLVKTLRETEKVV
jgi:electron transfer flavoprotein beta subunit